ncbi:MAG: hypothetical protein RIR69_345 [Actinomycetota bacterium]
MNDLDLTTLIQDFSINAVAIVLLAYVIYYRRHRRRETTVGYIATNVSLFVVAAALSSSTTLNVGVGFGLFAVLSIVRLRSDEATQSEIGYTMVALVIGLMTGLPSLDVEIKIVFSILLVATMYIVDHPRLIKSRRYQRLLVELDRIITDEDELHAVVGKQIGSPVQSLSVQKIDFVRETMSLIVRAHS